MNLLMAVDELIKYQMCLLQIDTVNGCADYIFFGVGATAQHTGWICT